MSYCTREEIRAALKDEAVSSIVGDCFIENAAQREAQIGPIIDAAEADAEGEIDGYLAKRYPVPLSRVPKIINKMAKDIAVYNLFSRSGIDENSEEKNYLNRYRAAIQFLTMVAEGRVSLGAEVEAPATAAGTGFTVQSEPRLFRRGQMQGM